jgi:hypothetical protein
MELRELPEEQLVPVEANGPVGAPVIAADAALPVFLRTIDCAAEVNPVVTDPKFRADGDSVHVGALLTVSVIVVLTAVALRLLVAFS